MAEITFNVGNAKLAKLQQAWLKRFGPLEINGEIVTGLPYIKGILKRILINELHNYDVTMAKDAAASAIQKPDNLDD